MSEVKLQKVYLPVSVKDELPTNNTGSIGITKNVVYENGEFGLATFYDDGFISSNKAKTGKFCWLKEQEGYFFSKDELKELLLQTFNAQDGQRNAKPFETFADYIKQLNL